MGERYKKYEELALLFVAYEDRINVYRDKTDGDYFLKIVNNGKEREYVDNIETDGKIDFADSSFAVSNSSYVAVTTYDSRKISKGRNQAVDRISVILSYEGYGILQSVFCNKGDYDLFSKLVKQNGFSKGTLEDYDVIDSENCSIIVPVIDEFRDYLDENNQKKLQGTSRSIR